MRYLLSLAGLFLVFPPSAHAFDPATQDDSRALVRHFERPGNPVGPPLQQGSFVPLPGETVSLMGGTDVFRMQESGYFEAMLQSAFPEKKLRVRNLGWSADTVERQQRPMFFYTKKGDERPGSVPDQRDRIKPGTFLLFFGKMESLAGEEGLERFESAYRGLLSELGRISRRIVVVSPIPFPELGPAAELSTERNRVLALYGKAIERLAVEGGFVHVSLGGFSPSHFESNGVYLSEMGQLHLAEQLAFGLGVSAEWSGGVLSLVREKDRIWDQYYRPTNWAFLYGDRQHVPSSRDHVDTNRRWFEEELKRIPALIEEKEEEIWQLVGGGSR